MPTVTPDHIARAEEVIAQIDAAPAEPGGEPVVTSNEDVAKQLIAEGIAQAMEDATGPPSDLEEQLAQCQATVQAMQPWVRVGRHLGRSMTDLLVLTQQMDRAQEAQREAAEKVAGDVAKEARDAQ